MHTDDSDVTFNCCLGRAFAGAGLTSSRPLCLDVTLLSLLPSSMPLHSWPPWAERSVLSRDSRLARLPRCLDETARLRQSHSENPNLGRGVVAWTGSLFCAALFCIAMSAMPATLVGSAITRADARRMILRAK